VGTLDAYGAAYHGLYLYEFIEKYNAIGGTNAGGFYDPNGVGNGGTPDGLVIRNGQIAWGSATGWYINVIGFDANNVLHVGDMSGQQALDLGMTSAVSFSPGPVLVKDGVMRTGLGGGMNPRTCIGQRADGTILLMVLEGRKPDSLGATYDDIAQIMYDYGAVNAANLDGGSSSLMYYKGEQITRGSNIIGMRQMSTAILVLN
jgi:exopolysaccharide biosynthesis protein